MSLISAFKRPADWMPKGFEVTSRWLESTLEVARWENMRRAGQRWGWWGASLGALVGVSLFAPATWLAAGLSSATNGRLILAEAEGTVWTGSAVAVLTGGPGSRDARSLPGRLGWTLRPQGLGLKLTLTQDCCLPQPLSLTVRPGWGSVSAQLQTAAVGGNAPVGQWPAAWLGGLGTPFNTLQLGGVMRLYSQGLQVQWLQGRLVIDGQAELSLEHLASKVTTLSELGSYRLSLSGAGGGPVSLFMRTEEGALKLNGTGSIGPYGLRFKGDASADEADRGALNNLLNIIGRRTGDRSVISIG
jgi:general secretion pathway protein N